MEDDKKNAKGWDGTGAHVGNGKVQRDGPPIPHIDARKKRRRKGQLNDGQWVPGYGPDTKKK